MTSAAAVAKVRQVQNVENDANKANNKLRQSNSVRIDNIQTDARTHSQTHIDTPTATD